MIFYQAHDDGRTHIVGTQADARAIDKQFIQIDIPTDKAGLMAYVQALIDKIEMAPVVGPEPGEEEAPDIPPPPEAAPLSISEGGAATEPENEIEIEDLPPSKVARIVCDHVSALGMHGEKGLIAIEEYQTIFGISAAFSRGVHILSVVCTGEHQLTRMLMGAKKGKRWGST